MEIHRRIIGLTGPNASGKGEVARYLTGKGYRYSSLSDIIRQEAKKLHVAPTRDNLINLGNSLRKKHGAAALAKKARKLLRGNSLVDSIRNPAEIDELRKIRDFALIGITAPSKTRFKRLRERGRAGDSGTLAEFIRHEKTENSLRSTGQQLQRCLKKADVIINNNSTLEKLHEKIGKFLEKLRKAQLG